MPVPASRAVMRRKLPIFAALFVLTAASAQAFLMPSDFDSYKEAAWRVEQALPDPNNPLVVPEMPWEVGGLDSQGTSVKDPIDGKWKIWNISTPDHRFRGDAHRKTWEDERRLSYLESRDGVHWTRPQLDLVLWNGSQKTNLLLGPYCSYASVNIDPKREWPYELFMLRRPHYPELAEAGLYRFRSKDGKAWSVVEGPITLESADANYIFHVPALGSPYVSYNKWEMRAFPGGLTSVDIADGDVRLIARRDSQDGSKWSDPPRIVVAPDWRDPPDTQFMELIPMASGGGFIGTVTVYHAMTQTIDLQFAASRDGNLWWRPGRTPTLGNGPLGDWQGGMIWPLQGFIRDQGRVYVYYGCKPGLHGELYQTGSRMIGATGEDITGYSSSFPDYSALCRASWQDERFWAVAPAIGGPYPGEVRTNIRALGGKKLSLNMKTRGAGRLRVELLDAAGAAIPGYSLGDCAPLRGDEKAAKVQWGGRDAMPGNAARLRFVLEDAYLYDFSAS